MKKKFFKFFLPLMIVGAITTAIANSGNMMLENPIARVTRGLKESYESAVINEIDCSEFTCFGVKGAYVEISELGDNMGIWVYHYADKAIVNQSIEQYTLVNTIPNMPKTLYHAHDNYFITATHGVKLEDFNKIIETIIDSIESE